MRITRHKKIKNAPPAINIAGGAYCIYGQSPFLRSPSNILYAIQKEVKNFYTKYNKSDMCEQTCKKEKSR